MTGYSKQFKKMVNAQNAALRDPVEIICGKPSANGLSKVSLKYINRGNFIKILSELGVTLLVTREYENMVVALSANRSFRQSFMHLPHPSGIVADRRTNTVYIAGTRNPNQIIELSCNSNNMIQKKFLLPSRIKFFSGSHYFHDLALLGKKLYANSVGKNGVLRVNFSSAKTDKICWSPLPKKLRDSNYIQLNSIAAGNNFLNSYFSASAEKPLKYRPGHLKFPVKGTGVIFSAKTKKCIVRGLTRPHSAKLYKKKIWINNSGYGELGFVEKGKFIPFIKLPGWTRGLCFINNIAFVGVSKVIPKFKNYAPGIRDRSQVCGVFAIDVRTKKILGSIEWPYGNQIFGIDFLKSHKCSGFPFTKCAPSQTDVKEIFYRYIL